MRSLSSAGSWMLVLVAGFTIGLLAEKPQQEIERLERQRFEAMQRNDLDFLDRVLAADLTYTHSSGRTETKAQFLESLRSGALKYKSIQVEDLKVRTFEKAAVLTGVADLSLNSGGQDRNFKIRYTDVYVRLNGRWQMTAWQSTRLP